jgi:hypothetical protein
MMANDHVCDEVVMQCSLSSLALHILERVALRITNDPVGHAYLTRWPKAVLSSEHTRLPLLIKASPIAMHRIYI